LNMFFSRFSIATITANLYIGELFISKSSSYIVP
jgi:hypothetical protein